MSEAREEGPAEHNEESLCFLDIRCLKPLNAYGDLHVWPQGMYFVAFQPAPEWKDAVYALLGWPGMWLMSREKKKRGVEMIEWRKQIAHKALEELVDESPESWSIVPEELQYIKKSLVGHNATIMPVGGKGRALTLQKFQWKHLESFARAHDWPLK